ncbi:MAG: nucleoid-associated protein [Candidatus Riflebacteria bacterium]|nr:nucleoid-associated protein [Candidatus Riflebacteria bacterium]
MTIQINNIVIHELVKEQHHHIQDSIIKDNVLDKNKIVIKSLAQKVINLFGTRNNTTNFGIFDTNAEDTTFQDKFRDYFNLVAVGEQDFIDLTKAAMDSLYTKAENQSGASGGYILFIDYKTNSRFFLVAMIKKKDGINLNDNLEPEEITQLELDKLYQVARINFNKYESFQNASEEDRMELSYLNFLKRNSSDGASGYFVSALGCSDNIAPNKVTDNLIKGSLTFFNSQDCLKNNTYNFKNKLLCFLNEKIKAKESAKLSEIERVAREFIPAEDIETADNIASQFMIYLNDECSIPSEFPVHQSTVTKYTQIRSKTSNYDLKFEKSALGTNEQDKVYYDREHKKLILSGIPDETIAQIESELAQQEQNQ